MLLLTSTSDKIQIITGQAANLDVHASWVDNNAGTITPGRTNTASITTATTTDVVGSPGASTQRNVKGLYVNNIHATASTTVAVQHTDGTLAKQLMTVTLLAGENLNLDAEGEWHHRDAQGAEYFPAWPPFDSFTMGYAPSGAIAETIPRFMAAATQAAAITGTLYMAPVYLRAGQKVSNISVFSSVAASGPTHGQFGLYSTAGVLLASCADFTTEAWTANAIKTKAMSVAYTVPTTGVYLVGVLATASTTGPTYAGFTGPVNLKGVAPVLGGTGGTAITALPANATITAAAFTPYAYVS